MVSLLFLFPWLQIKPIDVIRACFLLISTPSQAFVDFFSRCLHEEYKSKGIFVQVSSLFQLNIPVVVWFPQQLLPFWQQKKSCSRVSERDVMLAHF